MKLLMLHFARQTAKISTEIKENPKSVLALKHKPILPYGYDGNRFSEALTFVLKSLIGMTVNSKEAVIQSTWALHISRRSQEHLY